MANLLDKFKKNVVGSNSKVSDYTCKLTPSGEFTRINDLEAILNSYNAGKFDIKSPEEMGSHLRREILTVSEDIEVSKFEEMNPSYTVHMVFQDKIRFPRPDLNIKNKMIMVQIID